MKKKGRPDVNDLVICKITNINPNSAFASLIEYENLSGMIHVSEVASRWVRDIKEFLKENQLVVCRVMHVDGNHIALSVKRVPKDRALHKMNEYKKEHNAENLLEIVTKNLKKEPEAFVNEIGFELQEAFGTLSKALEIASKNEELFRKRSELDKKTADAIMDMVKKSYAEKVYTLKSTLMLSSYAPNGVEIIKKALLKAKKDGFEVKYISAPKYTISKSGKNFKELHSTLLAESEKIAKEVQKAGGEASFEVESRAKK